MLASRPTLPHRPHCSHMGVQSAAQGLVRCNMQPHVQRGVNSSTVLQHQSVQKPVCDRRLHQQAQLQNGVRVLVVQDKDIIYAAACANVQVGYFDDPPDLPGAAHFVEHMVHLGSKAFPDEKEYKAFLAQHGGSSNASTSMVHTRYHFKVHADALPGALQRFGAMLSCPVIAQDSSAREVENVHAEYSRNTNSDERKLLQLRRSLCQAPYSNFSTGSLTSLWEKPQQEGLDVPGVLRDLWSRFYTADATCVAVVGPQEPDMLLEWVAVAFAGMPVSNNSEGSSEASTAAAAAAAAPPQTLDAAQQQEAEQRHLEQLHIQQQQQPAVAIPAHDIPAATAARVQHRYPVDVVAPASRGLLVRVAPQRDLRELELSWYVPVGVMMHSSTKPWQWAAHLLGHEGPGSPAHLLKAQGLLQSLDVGMGEEMRLGRGWMFWRVRISLTQAGEDVLEHVVATVYRAVQVLQRCTDAQLQETWQEAATLAQLRFDWRDATDPLACAQSAAYALHYYPPASILSGPALMTQFDASMLKWFVGQLTPAAMNVYYSSRRNAALATCKEQWYGAQYAVQQLPQSWMDTIQQYLALDGAGTGGPTAVMSAAVPLVDDPETSKQQLQQQCQPTAGQLHLPEPNWAIPTDFRLRGEAGEAVAVGPESCSPSDPDAVVGVYGSLQPVPALLLEQPGLFAWHHRDTSYGLPKVHLKLHVATLAVYATPLATVATRLLLRVVEDLLLPQTYPAELAGSSYSLSSEQGGLMLKVVGFPGVAQQLLMLVVKGLLEVTLQQIQERFTTMSGRLQQALTNWANNNPAQHAEYAAHHLLQLQHHHNTVLLQAATAVTPEHLMTLQQQLASGRDLHVDMLAYGNISRREAVDVVMQLQRLLQPKGLPAGCWPPAKQVLSLAADVPVSEGTASAGDDSSNEHVCKMQVDGIPVATAGLTPAARETLQQQATATEVGGAYLPGGRAVYVTHLPMNPNPNNSNSAIYYAVQLGPDEVSMSVLLDLFVQMSSKAAFHALRTKQRLGYSVSLSSSSLHRQLGLVVRIQSPSTRPDVLAAAVQAWLCGFRAELADMLGKQLQQHKKALAAKYLEPPKSLQDAARRTWGPIHTRALVFSRREQKAAIVEALHEEQVLQFFDHYLHPDAAQHKALCVQIWGGAKATGKAAAATASGSAGALQTANAAEAVADILVAYNSQTQKQKHQHVVVLADEVEQFKQCRPVMPSPALHLPPHVAAALQQAL